MVTPIAGIKSTQVQQVNSLRQNSQGTAKNDQLATSNNQSDQVTISPKGMEMAGRTAAPQKQSGGNGAAEKSNQSPMRSRKYGIALTPRETATQQTPGQRSVSSGATSQAAETPSTDQMEAPARQSSQNNTTAVNSNGIVDKASLNLRNAADKMAASAASENVSETDRRKINRDLEAINGALQGIASMRGESAPDTQKTANGDNAGSGTKKANANQMATLINSYQNRQNEAAFTALKTLSETFGNGKLKITV